MLNTIRNFLSELSENEEPESLVNSRLQLSEAALMYHVIAVDGIVHEEEEARMDAVLERHFSLTPEETADLSENAAIADREAIDLYGFTSILKRALERRPTHIDSGRISGKWFMPMASCMNWKKTWFGVYRNCSQSTREIGSR